MSQRNNDAHQSTVDLDIVSSVNNDKQGPGGKNYANFCFFGVVAIRALFCCIVMRIITVLVPTEVVTVLSLLVPYFLFLVLFLDN